MNLNWHSIRTWGMAVILFIVAGLQALHDAPSVTQYASIIDMVLPVLIVVEHQLRGNS